MPSSLGIWFWVGGAWAMLKILSCFLAKVPLLGIHETINYIL